MKMLWIFNALGNLTNYKMQVVISDACECRGCHNGVVKINESRFDSPTH